MPNLIGDDFKLYLDTADDFDAPTWSELVDLGNLGEDPAPAQVEIPKRTGFTMYKKGRSDYSITGDLSYDPADTDHASIRDRIRAGTLTHLAIADGPIATTGTIYYHGWFLLVGPEDHSLDTAATIAIEAKVHGDSPDDELPTKVTV